ncbi:MAG: TonB-dependent receptor [Verrucomicrobia bacterium]|nr:TonB-dependent receptor [Verrucomicrobiota bacterium]
MNVRNFAAALLVAAPLAAQVAPVNLPEITVYSPRVANQSPAAAFAMPVSALRFEPRVDLQARNLTEAQADVTLRGGIFENTGFRFGAVSLSDPQTGHYYAEIPIAPAMLGAPEIVTGAEHALVGFNSTVGAIAYAWRPIKNVGAASVAAGDHGMNRQEFYQGYASDAEFLGQKVGADVAWGHSTSEGSVPFGESHFDRVSARIQLAGANSQTDLFAGYQAKFFGWPNLYTPFNSNESEDLETVLVALNHRVDLGGGDFLEAGVYHRRNKDDYAFNRFAAVGAVHPFQHTTWVTGAAVGGRRDVGALTLNFHGEILADDLHSTSLTAGKFHSRTLTKLALVPEKSWKLADGSSVILKAGATYDQSNHDGSASSPIVELAREDAASPLQRVYLSYATTTQLPSYTALNSAAGAGLFRGNPNLGRETSHNLEAGVSGTAAGWMGQAALFYRRDDDLVDWTFQRGVTARSANAVDIATTGAEFVARRSWSAVDLVLGYTVLGKSPDYRGALIDASFYALNYARQRFTAAIVVRMGREFELRFDNAARAQASNILRTTGGDNAVFSSLGLTYRPVAMKRTEFSLQVDNLWDSRFQEVPAVPAARRQISAGVAYGW